MSSSPGEAADLVLFCVPEDDVLQVKGVLYYTRGGNTDPQNILLGGNIPLRSHTVYIAKITGDIHEQCG